MNPTEKYKYDLMLETLALCYLKHHLNDPSIGWDELEDKIFNTLCEVMGDTLFQAWLENSKTRIDRDNDPHWQDFIKTFDQLKREEE